MSNQLQTISQVLETATRNDWVTGHNLDRVLPRNQPSVPYLCDDWLHRESLV